MNNTRNMTASQIIDNSKMSYLQVVVIAIVVFLDALDGFDLLSISFASPGIAEEWGISRVALGFVLSMELIGMGIGSVFIGRLTDQYGRRPAILGCLIVIALGMFMATTASNVTELSAWRIMTGLGIGGMLAAINAVAAEFSNNKCRNFSISLMVAGYPIGGVVGGIVASQLLIEHDWRSVFYFGGAVTLMFIPIVYFLVPESPKWLETKQPENALSRINAVLKGMGHAALTAIPDLSVSKKNVGFSSIFSRVMIVTTLLVVCVYLAHIMTFYFTIKWIPKIVVDLGYAASTAGGVLVWTNVGGIIGSLLFGYLSMRLGLNRVLIATLLLSSIAVMMFGQSTSDIRKLSMVSALVGFFTYAGVVGMYSLCARTFPTSTRAVGTGFVIGLGRVGAVGSPILAGVLFSQGIELPKVSMVMALGSLIAMFVVIIIALREKNDDVSTAI